jgi:hypothetical protein
MSERTLSLLASIMAVGAIDDHVGGKIESMRLLKIDSTEPLCNTALVKLIIADVRYTVPIREEEGDAVS